MAFINLYKILNIPSKANASEIKAAYRRLVKIWHPDRNQGSKSSEEKFKEIQSAYETLSNPKQKRLYDFKYKDELERAEETQTRPPQNTKPWKTADSYKSRLDRLWKQYENLHEEKNRTYNKRQKQEADEKYYYYNNEKITREEFQARAYQSYQKAEIEVEEDIFTMNEDRFDIFQMNFQDWEEYRRKNQMDGMLMSLGLLFMTTLVFLILQNALPFYWILLVLFLMSGIPLLKALNINHKLVNLVVELHSDKILTRGKDLQTISIHFQNIAQVRQGRKGLYIYPKLQGDGNQTQQTAAWVLPNIFIPTAIQGYEKISNALGRFKRQRI